MTITIKKLHLAIGIVLIALIAPATAFATHIFDDVPDGAFYADPVEWAAANGITLGVTADTFEPDSPVTRGESVTFLKRYHDTLVEPTQGAADVERVLGATVEVDMGDTAGAFAECPAGKVLTGGGHSTQNGTYGIEIFRSYPVSDVRWEISAEGVAGMDQVFRAYAICVTPA